MKIYRILFIVLATVIAAGFVVTFMANDSRTQNGNTQDFTKEIPVVDFYGPVTENPALLELRTVRGSKYDKGNLTEDFSDRYWERLDLPLSHAPVEPALPTNQSDLIIIGDVTESEAVLSGDRTNVYSEFTVRIKEIFKNTTILKNLSDANITVERGGGMVRFSSGKLLRLGGYGRGLLVKGGKYVLFLKWNEAGQDFTVLAGYGIHDDKVMPLDSNTKDSNLPVYRNYDAFKNSKVDDLIKQLKGSLRPEVPNKL
jgi:hypothetical protein